MLVFNDSGVRYLPIRIVDNCISLIVLAIQLLCLKTNRPVLKHAKLKSVELINHSGKYCLWCNIGMLLNKCKIVGIQKHINTIEHLLHDCRVTSDWNSLIAIIKIVVIIDETKRQSLDDECRKIFAVTSPLFFGISLYQLLINICSDE